MAMVSKKKIDHEISVRQTLDWSTHIQRRHDRKCLSSSSGRETHRENAAVLEGSSGSLLAMFSAVRSLFTLFLVLVTESLWYMKFY